MTQLEEFKKAFEEKRQPVCVYCGGKLDCVEQYQDEYIRWYWDDEAKRYTKETGSGNADKPFHMQDGCEAADWDFIEGSKEAAELGLQY